MESGDRGRPAVAHYYRADLARIHQQGFGFHAELCAPGLLHLLEPVRESGGLVLEVGAGAGALTGFLVSAGLNVVATDASPDMLALAAASLPGAQVHRLSLPDDPVPSCDAVVGVGHVLNYLPDRDAVDRALTALARALRPGGILALDLCDLAYGRARAGAPPAVWVEEDWALMTRFSTPDPETFVRDMTTFVRVEGDRWRRDDETHHNVLLDVTRVPPLLARAGVDARIRSSFGDEQLPPGLAVVVGRKA